MNRPRVFLALPHRSGEPKVPVGAIRTGQRADVRLRPGSTSLLPHCFNRLWCSALNDRASGLTHWAMLHDDVWPADGWLDVLLAEFETTRADVLSVVVPMKDERGLTSTAVRNRETGLVRRLTLAEVQKLPETFDAAGAGFPDHDLLVNTGCWICRLDVPWVEKVCFRELDDIHKDAAGRFHAVCLSEDWGFSLDCAKWGLKVLATRKVPVKHVGAYGFPSWGEWGTWETDREPSVPFAEVPE